MLYLVCLNSPDFHDALVQAEHVELVLLVEDGAAVRTRVVVKVEARRIRLRKEVSDVAQAGQRLPEELEVVDLLKADDVGVAFLEPGDQAVQALADRIDVPGRYTECHRKSPHIIRSHFTKRGLQCVLSSRGIIRRNPTQANGCVAPY